MSEFLKDFDSLLDKILTDYRNQFPEADTSKGSLIFIKSACLSSAIWGVYAHQEYIKKQIHPDTADRENLEHHCWTRELTRKTGESKAELLARLLAKIRQPEAGGNKTDYVKWALEVDGVKAAYCLPLGQGAGTVDVIILASGVSEIPDTALRDAVYDHIEELRPVTAKEISVIPPTVITQPVTMTVVGEGLNTSAIEADITALLNTYIPGQDLTIPRLMAIAISRGATDANVIMPAATVTASDYHMIRPGTINVTTA